MIAIMNHYRSVFMAMSLKMWPKTSLQMVVIANRLLVLLLPMLEQLLMSKD